MDFMLHLMLSLTIANVVFAGQAELEPLDNTVERGSSVPLVCTVTSGPPQRIAWTDNGVTIFADGMISSSDPKYDNFDILESIPLSIVTISDITVEDEGQYRCVPTIQGDEVPSDIATVTVEVRSTLTVNIFSPLTEGVEATAQCDAVGGRPQETLTWYIDNQEQTTGVVVTNPTNPTQGLTNTRSVLTFTPTAANDGQTLSCRITGHTLDNLNQGMNTALNVQPPSQAAPTSGSIVVTVEDRGTSLLVTCNITADPPPHPPINSYVIFQDGEVISNNNTALVSPLPESCTNFTCTASNELGNTTAVAPEYCPPVVPTVTLRLDPNHEILAAGDTYNATCTAIGGRPPQNITWFIESTQITTGISSSVSENANPSLSDTDSQFTYTASSSDHWSTLMCVTSSGAHQSRLLRVLEFCTPRNNGGR